MTSGYSCTIASGCIIPGCKCSPGLCTSFYCWNCSNLVLFLEGEMHCSMGRTGDHGATPLGVGINQRLRRSIYRMTSEVYATPARSCTAQAQRDAARTASRSHFKPFGNLSILRATLFRVRSYQLFLGARSIPTTHNCSIVLRTCRISFAL